MDRWLVWTMVTVFSWGIWAILCKVIGTGITNSHIQVVSTVGIIPIVAALAVIRDSASIGNRSTGILLAIGSGVISCLGNIAFYSALSHGGKAAAVIPITDLYPAVTVLLAVVLLKERLSRVQMAGIVLSLTAIYLFHVPQEEGLLSTWLLMALVPIVLWGVCGLMQKMATDHISGRSSALWFLLAFLPVAASIVVLDPLPADIAWQTWATGSILGFALAFGNLTVLLAFSNGGKASVIMPLTGLYPLVSIPIAIVVLGERVGWRESVGIALALTAVVMLSAQSSPGHSTVPVIEMDRSR